MKITDTSFDRVLTLRDAYRIMVQLVAEHVRRGEVSTLDFLTYVGITEAGYSGDPAAFDDYLRIAARILDRPSGRTDGPSLP